MININTVLKAIEEYLNKPKGTLYCFTSTIDTRIPTIKHCTVNVYMNNKKLFDLEENSNKENIDSTYEKLYKDVIIKLLKDLGNETSKN